MRFYKNIIFLMITIFLHAINIQSCGPKKTTTIYVAHQNKKETYYYRITPEKAPIYQEEKEKICLCWNENQVIKYGEILGAIAEPLEKAKELLCCPIEQAEQEICEYCDNIKECGTPIDNYCYLLDKKCPCKQNWRLFCCIGTGITLIATTAIVFGSVLIGVAIQGN